MAAPSPLRFALTFAFVFAVLMGGFEAVRGSAFERVLVEDVMLRPTVTLLNTVTPRESVRLAGRVLVSPDGANLRVVRGCEGIEMFVLLIAAIVAFPATPAQRLRGLAEGALLAYALSVLRLMALHYVLRYSPSGWEALHGLVLPLGPLLLLALYFLHWTASATAPVAAGAR